MADAVDAAAIDAKFANEMIDGAGDVVDIADVVFSGLTATTAAGVPAQFVCAEEARYRCAVQISDDKAVGLGERIQVQPAFGLAGRDALRIAEPAVQHDHQRAGAAGWQFRRRINDHAAPAVSLGRGLRGCGQCTG